MKQLNAVKMRNVKGSLTAGTELPTRSIKMILLKLNVFKS